MLRHVICGAPTTIKVKGLETGEETLKFGTLEKRR